MTLSNVRKCHKAWVKSEKCHKFSLDQTQCGRGNSLYPNPERAVTVELGREGRECAAMCRRQRGRFRVFY